VNLGEIIPLKEPQLQFSTGRHNLAIDPRFGLATFHPLDCNTGKRDFSSVDIGVLAKEDEIKTVLNLLNRLNNSFEPEEKGSKVGYKSFEKIYEIPINIPEIGEDKIISITNSEINGIIGREGAFENIIRLYNSKIQQYVEDNRTRDVLILQMPEIFERYFKFNYEDLRAHIKTLCVKKHVYTQILTKASFRPFDMSDNMWNLSLGLYVKAGGVPWKLESGEENTCFIGIAFGIKKGEGGQEILVGLAEVFDVFGESVTIKVVEDEFKSEVGLHLSEEKASRLIKTAITGYESEKCEKPKRVIIHKTSSFNEDEKEGIEDALGDTLYDLVHLQLKTSLRLIPNGGYPPNRGTFWKINQEKGVLYTTGYVEEFRTYPGAATASPIEINRNYGATELKTLAEQVFGLTKMNWNTTVLMNKEPITIEYARKVNGILKSGIAPEGILKDFRYHI
jgi:hypothetical protein